MKRHKAALGIQQGARNVRAIARTLVEATDEAAREGIGAEQDAAVRMIVHRLARVCNVEEITYGFDPSTLKDVYCTLMAECEARADEITQGEPSPEKREDALPISPVSTTSPDRGTVAVVLHEGVDHHQKKGAAAEAQEFSEETEQRRGLLSRFLFGGD